MNLKWGEMIQNNEKSLTKVLSARTSALMKISRVADFKTRKMIGKGKWQSKLLYMSVWGGTEEYLQTALQSMQNRAAKIICNRGRRYSATQALQDVGWMDVRTLVKYHSLVQTKKVLDTREPLYLHEKLVGGKHRPFYATRLVAGGDLRGGPGSQPRLELASNSWRHRVQREWSEVPVGVRTSSKLVSFKTELRKWLKK